MGCSASISAKPSSDADEKVRQVAAAPVGKAETEKTRRAKELGINASAVSAASGALAVAARSDLAASSVRIFQFNVLADGLSGACMVESDVSCPSGWCDAMCGDGQGRRQGPGGEGIDSTHIRALCVRNTHTHSDRSVAAVPVRSGPVCDARPALSTRPEGVREWIGRYPRVRSFQE